jgi:hypothetical protein
LGFTLNNAQLAQAKNMSGNLEGLLEVKGHRYAFDLKFLKLILDIIRAVGHLDARCVKMMTKLVA